MMCPIRLSLARAAALAPFWLAMCGCQYVGVRGGVSRTLMQSRQLAQQGRTALDRQDWLAAEQLLARAVKACDVDPEARRHHAEALWRLGRPQEALPEMAEAIRLAPDDASLHARLAAMQLASGDAVAAMQSAQQAIDLDPLFAEAWAIRARVHAASGQPAPALADYQRALGLVPDDRAILLEVAELYRQANQPRRALANLQRLAELYAPGEEPQQVLYLQGLALAALARHGDAAETLAAARDRGPAGSELLHRLAEEQLFADQPQAAEQTLQQALAADPAHAPSLALLDRLERVKTY